MRAGRLQGFFQHLLLTSLKHYIIMLMLTALAGMEFHNMLHLREPTRVAEHLKIIHIYCRTKQLRLRGCEFNVD